MAVGSLATGGMARASVAEGRGPKDTGETRLFDARPYLNRGVILRLRDPDLFRQAYVAFGMVCWPGELDIAPETLYDASVPTNTAARPGGGCGSQLPRRRLADPAGGARTRPAACGIRQARVKAFSYDFQAIP